LFSVLPWRYQSQADTLRLVYEEQCRVIQQLLAEYNELMQGYGAAGGLDYVFTEKAKRYLEIQRENIEKPGLFAVERREYNQIIIDLNELNAIIDKKSVRKD
jgi:hypothetical protein